MRTSSADCRKALSSWPSLRSSARYAVQQPRKTCWPLSSRSPVSFRKEKVRPPANGRRSSSVTPQPASTRSMAAVSPARPAPTTTAVLAAGDLMAQLVPERLQPGAGRQAQLVAPAEADSPVEHHVAGGLDTLQDFAVDALHRRGAGAGAHVQQRQQLGSTPVEVPGALRLEGHQPAERLVVHASQQLLLGITEAPYLVLRDVDAAAFGVLLDVTHDVGELQRQAKVRSELRRARVAVAEDLQADQADH